MSLLKPQTRVAKTNVAHLSQIESPYKGNVFNACFPATSPSPKPYIPREFPEHSELLLVPENITDRRRKAK